MNESKNHAAMLYKTVPAVASLNHVNGFDPLKLLRRTRSAQTGEPVLKLDLRYKRLWFRLACPKGRLRLNALRITEQIAIFEAKVYRNLEDSEPISSYIAECSRDTTPGGLYVEAAQSEALNTALSNAGFGIQFADVAGGEDAYGSEIPADATPLILDAVPAGRNRKCLLPCLYRPQKLLHLKQRRNLFCRRKAPKRKPLRRSCMKKSHRRHPREKVLCRRMKPRPSLPLRSRPLRPMPQPRRKRKTPPPRCPTPKIPRWRRLWPKCATRTPPTFWWMWAPARAGRWPR